VEKVATQQFGKKKDRHGGKRGMRRFSGRGDDSNPKSGNKKRKKPLERSPSPWNGAGERSRLPAGGD